MEIEMRQKFAQKSGKILKDYPYYLVFSNDDSPDEDMIEFYKNGDFIKISANEFDMSSVSFTYGDSLQQYYDQKTFGDKAYRNIVYTYEEILEIIKEYGWITTKANDAGRGNPRFIEA